MGKIILRFTSLLFAYPTLDAKRPNPICKAFQPTAGLLAAGPGGRALCSPPGRLEHKAPLHGASDLRPQESSQLALLAKGACAEEEKGNGKENERTRLLFIDKTLQLSKDVEV